MKIFQISTLSALLSLFTSITSSPVATPLDGRSPKYSLENVLRPACQSGPRNHMCVIHTLTRKSGHASVYLFNWRCEFIGYEPKVQIEKDFSFNSELGAPIKLFIKDKGWQPMWEYGGVKNGLVSAKVKKEKCRKDENEEVHCSSGFYCDLMWTINPQQTQ